MSDHAVLIAHDGSEWPVDGSAAPILAAAGRITGIVLVFHEISAGGKRGGGIRVLRTPLPASF
jgi:hypothetical protein